MNLENDDVICSCSGTTREKIQQLIDDGVDNLDRISRITGACSGCGSCDAEIFEMLSENRQSQERLPDYPSNGVQKP